jgi:hypothetical protein
VLAGEIDKYRIRWKLTTDSEWLDYVDVPPSAALCAEEEADLVCHTLPDLGAENYTLQVQAFNRDIGQGSAWSAAVSRVLQDGGAEGDDETGDDETQSHVLTAFTVLAVAAACALAVFLGYHCCVKLPRRRRKGFDRVLSHEEYRNKPIIRSAGQPFASGGRPLNVADAQNSYVDQSGWESAAARRSCLDPLPPLPLEEPIYSDLELRKGASSEEYLAPDPVRWGAEEGEEEEGYLAPNPGVRVESRESLDEEGYLRPNFNRFQRLDTTRQAPDYSILLV